MTKRENGAGSVYRRARDGRWVAAFVDPITGRLPSTGLMCDASTSRISGRRST